MIQNILVVLMFLLKVFEDGVMCTKLKSRVSENFLEIVFSAVQNKEICGKNSYSTHKKEHIQISNKFGTLHTFKAYSEWAMREEITAKRIRIRLHLLKSNLQLIKKYIDGYQISLSWNKLLQSKSNKFFQNVGGLFKGSVSSYSIIQRYITALGKIRHFLGLAPYKRDSRTSDIKPIKINPIKMVSSKSKVDDSRKSRKFIGFQDKLVSMMTFLQVQECYLFEPAITSKGLEIDTLAGGNLNSLHSAEMGIFALKRRRYNMAVDWLEHAIKIFHSNANFSRYFPRVSENLLLSLLRTAYQDHNRMKIAIQNETDPDYEILVTLYLTPIMANQSRHERIAYRNYLVHYNRTADKEEADFIHLCHGNNLQTHEIQKRLKCFYEKRRHPYLYVNPVKVEQLSESPPIFQFYEMLGNETIKKIVEKMQPLVEPSEVVGGDEVEYVLNFRSSAGVVMRIEDAPNKVHLLSEMVSGLRISNNSEFQYVEYSYGRFYTYHEDTFRDYDVSVQGNLQKYGNRLATLLYYMELPVLGGYTPFLNAGIYSRPVGGSAVLWLNMHRNGSLRDDVVHASCPVLHGHKIVMNHWIRSYDNFNQWKCTLNQYE